MRKRVKLAAGALLAVAVLALPAAAAAPPERDGITVSGTHAVLAAPDVSEWTFGVEVRAGSAKKALGDAGARMRRVVAAIRAAGVAPEDVRTENVSLYPRVGRGNKVVGYTAASHVRVVVRTVSRSGGVIGAAVDAGATDVFGPSLIQSNREELYRRALEGAYDEAKAKAQRLAAKVGVTLGAPVAIVEGGGDVGYAVEAAGAATDDVGVEPGRSEIPATVTVTFALS